MSILIAASAIALGGLALADGTITCGAGASPTECDAVSLASVGLSTALGDRSSATGLEFTGLGAHATALGESSTAVGIAGKF